MNRVMSDLQRLHHVLCYLERQEYETEYGQVEFDQRTYQPAAQIVREIYWAQLRAASWKGAQTC